MGSLGLHPLLLNDAQVPRNFDFEMRRRLVRKHLRNHDRPVKELDLEAFIEHGVPAHGLEVALDVRANRDSRNVPNVPPLG